MLETPHTTQGAATFRRTLDMRDDHPAKMNLTGLCAIEVSTPHGQNLLHRKPSLPCRATSFNGEGGGQLKTPPAFRQRALQRQALTTATPLLVPMLFTEARFPISAGR